MEDQETTQDAAREAPSKIHVGGYKKADGTKVSEYARAPPGGAKRPAEEGDTPTPEGSFLKKPLMSVEEYLDMALKDQATSRHALCPSSINHVLPKAAALRYMADGDPVNQTIIEQDAASNAAAQIPEDPMEPPGLDQFLVDIQAEATHKHMLGADIVQSIITNATQHKYDDEVEGSWGKTSLVPHLQMAGLYDTALLVQSLQYKF